MLTHWSDLDSYNVVNQLHLGQLLNRTNTFQQHSIQTNCGISLDRNKIFHGLSEQLPFALVNNGFHPDS